MVEALIPRRILFGNPVAFNVSLSLDGEWITWIAPLEGVLNIWIAPRTRLHERRPVTRTRARPIEWRMWIRDGRQTLYMNDLNGDENYAGASYQIRAGRDELAALGLAGV